VYVDDLLLLLALTVARSLMGNRLTVLGPGLIGEANSPNMTLFGRCGT
jgi:hypothetical protein